MELLDSPALLPPCEVRPQLPPLAMAEDPAVLEAEVRSLPPSCCLESSPFALFLASADRIPTLLREIGRLRELTFRLVGEGTGQSRDLDRFDPHYHHLFLWDETRRCIVGAYRMGFTREIIAQHGPDGLYTQSLYHFEPELLGHLVPGIELGRSFIAPLYQKHPQALFQLWRGIGLTVAAQPDLHKLFGPASISNDYSLTSKCFVVEYLRRHRLHPVWSEKVQARVPFVSPAEFHPDFPISPLLCSKDPLAFVSQIEPDGKGIPILLKHYLKLNSCALSFSIDHDFSGVLDVLLLTDLRFAPDMYLKRYMGSDGWKKFRDHVSGDTLRPN